jgi:uncharacterized protein YcfJ
MASIKSDEKEQTNVLIGMGAGGTAAALAGAAIGAVSGGPVGAIAGAALGGMIGSVSGGALAYGEVEPEFRREYESSTTTSRGSQQWEDISPAYRYGWESHDRPEFHGKAWTQVNSDLEKGWTGGAPWSAYEPHIKSGWERRSNLHEARTDAQAIDNSHEQEPLFGRGTEELGSLAIGGSGGAFIGGTMGLLVGGPIGMAVGGTLGTIAGAVMAHEAATDWHEPAFHESHESFRPQGGHPWEQAKPAYRYGWDAHDQREIGGKTWDEALPELKLGWPGPGTFAEYEPYIKEGWERRLQPKLQPKGLDQI